MASAVNVWQLMDAMDKHLRDATIYIDRKSGRLECVPDDNSEEGIVLPAEGPSGVEPAHTAVLSAEQLNDGEHVVIPDHLKVQKWERMKEFAAEDNDPTHRRKMFDVIHGPRPFRDFLVVLEELNLHNKWVKYRDIHLKDDVIQFLEENQIPYTT